MKTMRTGIIICITLLCNCLTNVSIEYLEQIPTYYHTTLRNQGIFSRAYMQPTLYIQILPKLLPHLSPCHKFTTAVDLYDAQSACWEQDDHILSVSCSSE
eukprot:scpid76071/ scgid24723/ 